MLKHLWKTDRKLIDLTHTLNASVPTWNGSCGFEQALKMDYEQGCRVQAIKMHAGVGTHMDAPSHFIRDGLSVADIPLENLIVPVCVLDVSNKCHPLYMISEADILAYEKTFQQIPEKCLVIAYTGWDKYWQTPSKYRNQNKNGHMEFPGFSKKAAEMLVERNVAGIGIDTLSPDGSDMTFPVHHTILGSGGYIIENLTQCNQLPPMGAYVITLPLKAENGTESAIRAVGLV